jgi:hypothetical protein
VELHQVEDEEELVSYKALYYNLGTLLLSLGLFYFISANFIPSETLVAGYVSKSHMNIFFGVVVSALTVYVYMSYGSSEPKPIQKSPPLFQAKIQTFIPGKVDEVAKMLHS